MKGIMITFTRDCNESIGELDQISKELKKLQRKYPFIKDWEVVK